MGGSRCSVTTSNASDPLGYSLPLILLFCYQLQSAISSELQIGGGCRAPRPFNSWPHSSWWALLQASSAMSSGRGRRSQKVRITCNLHDESKLFVMWRCPSLLTLSLKLKAETL